MSDFSKELKKQRAIKRVAYVIFEMWEESGSSDTRLLLPPMIADEYIIVGESIKGKEYKEHVVPRILICKECHNMFANNKSIDDVAKFIKKHLKIVWITKDEQKKLDLKNNLNLKQTMPKGWIFGNDIYARLKKADIIFNPYTD